MFKPIRSILASASACALVATAASAQGVPVSDVQGLLKQIETYSLMLEDHGVQLQQLEELRQQLGLLQEQLDKLKDLEALLKNPSDVLSLLIDPKYAGLLEGKFDASLVETLSKGAKGDWSGLAASSSGQFTAEIDNVLKSAGTSQAEVASLATSDNPRARNNAAQTTSHAATSAAAEISYKEANQLTERTQTLVAEIKGLNTLKQSVDHNTRVTAELAIALAAMWQLEAVQTVNVGATGVADAATIAEVEKFLDFSSSGFEVIK